MSTPRKRPPADTRTPQELARACAALATAPLTNFGAFINDDARDQQWQQLVTRLTADEPSAWSTAREEDVVVRLRSGGLPTEETRALFAEYDSHRGDEAALREAAAFLVGVEVGRQQTAPPDDGLTPEQRAELGRMSPALRATLARGDCLARFHQVERFLSFMEGYAMIADASGEDIPINSVGMEFVGDAAGEAVLTLRKLRQEFETAEGGAA